MSCLLKPLQRLSCSQSLECAEHSTVFFHQRCTKISDLLLVVLQYALCLSGRTKSYFNAWRRLLARSSSLKAHSFSAPSQKDRSSLAISRSRSRSCLGSRMVQLCVVCVWQLCLIFVGAQSSAVSAARDYKRLIHEMRAPEAEGCLPYFTAICGRNRFVALGLSIAVFALGTRTSAWVLQVLHSQRRAQDLDAQESAEARDAANAAGSGARASAGKCHGE